jgi:hypothetical protein
VNTAATVTNQSGIAAVNANIASILAGSSALETLNVSNEVVGGSNRLEIKNKPDALNTASLQIEHELTASAQQAKVNFWDTSIPDSASTNSSNALTLSWDADSNAHTSTFAGGVTVAGQLFVGGVEVTGGGAAASAGDVLKSTRTQLTQGNVQVPTNGSWQTIWTHIHTPSDAQSHLHITVAAVFKLGPQSGISDGERRLSLECGGTTCGGTVLVTEGSRETGSSSPILGKYTNSSRSSAVPV